MVPGAAWLPRGDTIAVGPPTSGVFLEGNSLQTRPGWKNRVPRIWDTGAGVYFVSGRRLSRSASVAAARMATTDDPASAKTSGDPRAEAWTVVASVAVAIDVRVVVWGRVTVRVEADVTVVTARTVFIAGRSSQ